MEDLIRIRKALNHKVPEKAVLKTEEGLSEEVVRFISEDKKEPEWMLKKRLQALKIFYEKPMPDWGPSLEKLDLNKIIYYIKAADSGYATDWNDVPPDVRETFDKLGIPEVERKYLGGSGAQFESINSYHKLKEEWSKKGVIFEDMDVALQKYPNLVKEYFMTRCVPISDHKFAALHGAVWSGGTFIYVPKNVKVTAPLQAYFRMNSRKAGQFEHTLIIVDENAELHYIESCSAPQYNESSIHAGCVEIYVKKGARCRYSSVENWSRNTFNLNTKRSIVEEDGVIEWINGNLGCLSGDSKIFTNPKGPINIKSMETGDKVYVWDEKTNSIKKSIVKAKIFSGYKNVYKIEAGGREIESSANHPFLTLVRKKNNPSHKKGFFYQEWRPLENLKVGDVIGIAKRLPIKGKPYKLPIITMENIIMSNNQYAKFSMNIKHLYNQDIIIPPETNEDFMWLCGILTEDGHVDLKHNKINIAVYEKEDYREELCNVLKRLFNYTVTEKKVRYIIINSKVLCQLFIKIGMAGTAGTKQVPDWVFALPRSQILSFLAGYFDSDGHAVENAIAFTSINKQLLEQVKMLGISIGCGVSRIFKHGNSGKKEILGIQCNAKDSWRLLFNGRKIKELPSRSKRKKTKIKNIKTRIKYVGSQNLNFKSKTNEEVGFARINKITPIGVKPTFDIEVKNYHNFIANGLIVHNSGVTMLYPCSVLIGERARSDFIGIAFAADNQNQDTGHKVYHLASNTKSTVQSKSISKGSGITIYRGVLKIKKGSKNCKSNVQCDALMLDSESKSDTIPYIEINDNTADIGHEATTGKISEEQIFYLQSRGLSSDDARKMVVSGFIEPMVKELPGEYAVELNRLIELEMDKSVG